MGMLPGYGPGHLTVEPGLGALAMYERASRKELDVLCIFGANPARNAADPAAAAAALEAASFVVVSELFMTETAQRATLVLPAAGAFEKGGTTVNLAGDLLPVNASLDAPDFVRSDFEIIAALADELDVALPSIPQIEGAVIAAVIKEPKDFTLGDARFAPDAAESTSRNGYAGDSILSGGGTWQHDPWIAGLRSS
jgi:anaerobic selenocysteine-containing dehydrogenase